jgi:hypothetical protein
MRRARLRRRPVTVSATEVRAALGTDLDCALEAAARALPCVERWRAGLLAENAAALLSRADAIVAHRFDLLGSGPVDLGPEIDWHRDFKSGRQWPLEHISKIVISYPDRSDIKVPWELSRCQHLPLLAAAYRVSGDRRYVREIGAQVCSWIDANPVEVGVNWTSTMDVALRAVSWVAALVTCREAVASEPWLERAAASLLLHGRFIRSHLEYSDARGNHYLSNVVGLLVIAPLFAGSQVGRGWADWGAEELAREVRHQVRPDGSVHEASTSYHRLVAELFILGADAVDAALPGQLDPEVRTGIERMLDFTAAYLRPDGHAPQIGDADDARVLPLGDYAATDQRDHRHLFIQARRAPRRQARSVAFPDGGFYVLREGDLHAVVRCGDVGIHGRGCHAHNDQLSFDLAWRSRTLVIDPGSYVYTADPNERNRFRATRFHSTLSIDGAEQNELRTDRLFAMLDRSRAEALLWEVKDGMTVFAGRHHGYSSLPGPTLHERRLELRPGSLRIVDAIESEAAHDVEWTLPLAPCNVAIRDRVARASFPGVRLRVRAPRLDVHVDGGWVSPSYGVRHPAPFLRLRGRSMPGRHVVEFVIEIDPALSSAA